MSFASNLADFAATLSNPNSVSITNTKTGVTTLASGKIIQGTPTYTGFFNGTRWASVAIGLILFIAGIFMLTKQTKIVLQK